MSKLLALTGAAVAALVPVYAADATTYTASRAVGTQGSVNLSITTDSVIGNVAASDITAFTITITDLATPGTFTLTQGNAQVGITGGLTATATALSFDFSSNFYALFQNPSLGSAQNFYCLAGGLCGKYTNAENLLVGSNYDNVQTNARRGVTVVATAATATVPEPASWAMFIGGFGLIGSGIPARAPARGGFTRGPGPRLARRSSLRGPTYGPRPRDLSARGGETASRRQLALITYRTS